MEASFGSTGESLVFSHSLAGALTLSLRRTKNRASSLLLPIWLLFSLNAVSLRSAFSAFAGI
jgi:hypothetical protein